MMAFPVPRDSIPTLSMRWQGKNAGCSLDCAKVLGQWPRIQPIPLLLHTAKSFHLSPAVLSPKYFSKLWKTVAGNYALLCFTQNEQ